MKLITAKEAAPIVGLEKTTQVYDAARKKLIPAVWIGRRVRFDPEALREWAKKGGTPLNDVSARAEAT